MLQEEYLTAVSPLMKVLGDWGFPDLNCDVEHCTDLKMEQQDIHKVINQLNSEERMIIYGIFFENKTQTQMEWRLWGAFQTDAVIQAEIHS